MNKKQPRGLRRHFRGHQRRALTLPTLDIASLTQRHVDYHQFGIAPWYDHQRPPKLFRQLWLGHLVKGFKQWQAQLSQYYADYYLAVWVFESRFGNSQLVAAVADRQAHYENLFGEAGPFRPAPARELPPEYRAVPGISGLRWKSHADIQALTLEDFADLGRWASSKPHWEGKTVDGEPYIAVQVGWVWVGQRF